MDYVVKEGDTLFLIAQQFGLTLSALIKANPQIKNPDIILPGQTIRVPKNGTGAGIPGQKPLHFISATEDNRRLQGAATVPIKPKITLTFDKNVVNENVWENNRKSITLLSKKNVNIPLKVTRTPDTEDFSQRKKIYAAPVSPLSPGTSYTLKISPNLKSKAGQTLGQTTGGQSVTIRFSTVKKQKL